jgi:hypothetical protein
MSCSFAKVDGMFGAVGSRAPRVLRLVRRHDAVAEDRPEAFVVLAE